MAVLSIYSPTVFDSTITEHKAVMSFSWFTPKCRPTKDQPDKMPTDSQTNQEKISNVKLMPLSLNFQNNTVLRDETKFKFSNCVKS